MAKGSGSSSTTVDKNLLPDYAQPQVQAYLSRSNTLSLRAYTPYPDITYAAQNADEIDGIANLASRGRNGHPIISKAETLLRDTFDFDKFNIPEITDDAYSSRAEAIIQEFEEDILPKINQRFNLLGNYGSDSHHIVQAKAAEQMMAKLSEIGVTVYSNHYFNERENLHRSLAYSIEYGSQDMINAELLRLAGMYAREYTQGSYEDLYKKWRDEQEGSIKRLELLGNAIRAMVGAQVTETKPFYRPGTMSQLAGIALAGGSMFSMLYGMRSDVSSNVVSSNANTTNVLDKNYNLHLPSLTLQ